MGSSLSTSEMDKAPVKEVPSRVDTTADDDHPKLDSSSHSRDFTSVGKYHSFLVDDDNHTEGSNTGSGKGNAN